MNYLPKTPLSYAARELLDDVVYDILYGDVTAHTISKAQQIANVADELDLDFVLMVAGGNSENLNELNKLALEELIRYLQGGDDDNDSA